MNYEEMSDFEINLLAYSLVEGKQISGAYKTEGWFDVAVVDFGEYYQHSDIPNYCSNPSHAWSIIVENGIGINKTLTRSRKEKGTWYADRGIGVELTFNDNPLRAAMICFLKMKDAER